MELKEQCGTFQNMLQWAQIISNKNGKKMINMPHSMVWNFSLRVSVKCALIQILFFWCWFCRFEHLLMSETNWYYVPSHQCMWLWSSWVEVKHKVRNEFYYEGNTDVWEKLLYGLVIYISYFFERPSHALCSGMLQICNIKLSVKSRGQTCLTWDSSALWWVIGERLLLMQIK